MYYEKLLSIYHSSDCEKAYSPTILTNLDKFISEELKQNKRLLSPYKFAHFSGLSIRLAIQFFMYFAQKDGVFNIKYFFECSRTSCGERIYLSKNEMDINHYFNCPECDKEYLLEDIVRYLKAYFELKQEIILPQILNDRVLSEDPNSTYFAFKGIPDHLKEQSPSSFIKYDIIDEGDSPISAVIILELNEKPDGQPIISDMELLAQMAKYLRS